MQHRKLLLFIVCCFGCSAVFGQQPEAIIGYLQKNAAQYPQERVYVHLDKPAYITGDDIWLKGYITLGQQNQLSALSRVLHADLVSPEGKLVSSSRFLILHGVSMGNIHLPDSLEEGIYHLRAYTNWMLNFAPQAIFNQAITILRIVPQPVAVNTKFSYDTQKQQLDAILNLKDKNGSPLANNQVEYALLFDGKATGEASAKTDANGNLNIGFNISKNYKPTAGVLLLKTYMAYNKVVIKHVQVVLPPENKIQFMPESGSMVAGLQSRIAFKMLKPDGLGASGSGYITDDAGNKVAEFSSSHAGMGSFYITPAAGKKYKAVINYDGGLQAQTIDMPAALAEGYVLTLNQTQAGFLNLAVAVSANLVKNQKCSLLIQKQGNILFFGSIVANNTQLALKLPLAGYPPGIIQVTLFNEAMQPTCERLFFNLDKSTLLPLTANINAQAGLRKPVAVAFTAGMDSDSMRVGSFSASVVNLSRLPQQPDNACGIAAGLLLTPDLKGYIEQPDYYFDDYNTTKKYELDNLILCQGWRNISWDDVKAGKTPVIAYQPEKGFNISGLITQNGKPVANAKVNLLRTGSMAHIDTTADANGHFVFERLLLNDSTQFAIQATDASGNKKVNIKVDEEPALPVIPGRDIPYITNEAGYQDFSKNNYDYLADSTKARLSMSTTALKQVIIKGEKVNKIKYSANFNGAGVADEAFTADDLKTAQSIKQYLEGRALGIRFEGETPYTTRSTVSEALSKGGDPAARPMQVFIDGIHPVDQMDPFVGIEIDDVESIEILRRTDKTAIYGAPEGVILITMKKANIKRFVPFAPNYISAAVAGYSPIRAFYVPDYDVHQSSAPDHRATVYWKPDIVTDKAGNASFKFFTSDDKGTYQLRIEGMTADGRLAHLVKTIQVN